MVVRGISAVKSAAIPCACPCKYQQQYVDDLHEDTLEEKLSGKKAIVHGVCASFQIGAECCEEKANTSKIYNQPAVLNPP